MHENDGSRPEASSDDPAVYADYNATAPLRPEARAAMLEAFGQPGNPSSVHRRGRTARARLERARRQVAAFIGAEAEQGIFTSGGTDDAEQIPVQADGLVDLTA